MLEIMIIMIHFFLNTLHFFSNSGHFKGLCSWV